jgi:hypothetical protein
MTRLPGKSFQIAGALALSGILAAMVSGMREPPSPAPVTTAVAAPVVTKAVFAERFDVPNDQPPLKKQDRLPLPPEIRDPVPVKTETVVMTQPDDQIDVKKKAEPKKPEKPTKTAMAEHDVCTRHGLHKIWIRHGRSWRCRR